MCETEMERLSAAADWAGLSMAAVVRQAVGRDGDRHGQTVACDEAYIAAAESVAASFWTADSGLYLAARAAGADWVHQIQKPPA